MSGKPNPPGAPYATTCFYRGSDCPVIDVAVHVCVFYKCLEL